MVGVGLINSGSLLLPTFTQLPNSASQELLAHCVGVCVVSMGSPVRQHRGLCSKTVYTISFIQEDGHTHTQMYAYNTTAILLGSCFVTVFFFICFTNKHTQRALLFHLRHISDSSFPLFLFLHYFSAFSLLLLF